MKFVEILGFSINTTQLLFISFLIHYVASPQESSLPNESSYEKTVKLESEPLFLRPQLYIIDLTIPFEAFSSNASYYGTVTIIFGVDNKTDTIKLHHSKEISSIILSVSIEGRNINNESISEENDQIIITWNESFSPDEIYNLTVNFKNTFDSSSMDGFYKGSYTSKNTNQTQYFAFTQFEPVNARKVFPCIDEPAFKARFNITLRIPKDMTALSNTNSTVTYEDEKYQEVKFQHTPKMSTYLVAFLISNFYFTATNVKMNEFEHKIFSRYEDNSTRTWAAEIEPQLLAFFNNYTEIDYGKYMTKLYHVAIPQFDTYGMENWGLITYKEEYLLWDHNESSNSNKQDVATLMAHEIAHQWFGNLVTMKCYNGKFLKEGLVTLFEHISVHNIRPEWQMDKKFVIDVVQLALHKDTPSWTLRRCNEAEEDVKPLYQNISCSDQIDNNAIDYKKGASIFRMIEHMINTSNFQSGLREYLKKYEFSNTEPYDLWEQLQNVSEPWNFPECLSKIMDNWIKEPYYPLINVKLEDRVVTLTQSIFGYPKGVANWIIPLSYTISSDENKFNSTYPLAWLFPNSSQSISLPNDGWIIVNNQLSGFYRVNYDDTLWNRIEVALKSDNFGGIHELNRAQIIDDLFSLAEMEVEHYSEVLSRIEFLSNDTSYFTWKTAFKGFDYLLENLKQNETLYRKLSKYLLPLMENLYNSTKNTHLNGDDLIHILKKNLVRKWACFLEHEECIQEMKKLFSNYKSTRTRPDKNFRDIIYCNALRYSANSSDWDFLWNEYLLNKVTLSTENLTILESLACTHNTTLLEKYLNLSLDETSGIQIRDRKKVFESVMKYSAKGLKTVLKFIIENSYSMNESLPKTEMEYVLDELTKRFTTQGELKSLNVLEGKNYSEIIQDYVKNAKRYIRYNIEKVEKIKIDLEKKFPHGNVTTHDSISSWSARGIFQRAVYYAENKFKEKMTFNSKDICLNGSAMKNLPIIMVSILITVTILLS